MGNPQHVSLLKSGVLAWNSGKPRWPDLKGEDFNGLNLAGVNLDGADLTEASFVNSNLGSASLRGAFLSGSKLQKASLRKANLYYARFVEANLSEADLDESNLTGATLDGANLNGASLSRANLTSAHLLGTQLIRANLSEANMLSASLMLANLSEANLSWSEMLGTNLVKTQVQNAVFDNALVYGISAWDIQGIPASTKDLVIAPSGQGMVTVDNLKVAQFVYLLLSNSELRDVIDTLTAKVVLILGRFAPERKVVLDALRNELRKRDYIPVIFDFDKPVDRDFTETVMTLAGMSNFIIADLTQPKSSPLESHATITTYMVPFVPIIQEGEWPFSMFLDLQRKHHWVLKTLKYKDKDDLMLWVDKIISKANAKHSEIQLEKAKEAQEPSTGEEW